MIQNTSYVNKSLSSNENLAPRYFFSAKFFTVDAVGSLL